MGGLNNDGITKDCWILDTSYYHWNEVHAFIRSANQERMKVKTVQFFFFHYQSIKLFEMHCFISIGFST